MEAEVVVMAEKKMVGMGSRFISGMSPETNASKLLPGLWHSFVNREKEIANIVAGFGYGVCEEAAEPRGHAHELYYLACVEVREFGELPLGMERRVVPGGRYLLFTHRGPVSRLGETMKQVYGEAVPRICGKMGVKVLGTPHLEVYDHGKFKGEAGDSEMGIGVPVG